MISVVLPTYNNYDYIFECIDSIISQDVFINKNDEILIGVDGWHDSVDAIYDIAEDDSRMRVFVMEERVGTYVVLNTLLKEVKNDIIVRFNSDDIMCDGMMGRGIGYIGEYDIVRFGNYNFSDDMRRIISTNRYPRCDTFMAKKSVIDGWKPWMREADRDFIERTAAKIKDIGEPLFFKRIHPDSMFYDNLYGFHSSYSRGWRRQIGLPFDDKPRIVGYKEVDDYGDRDALPISIVISAYGAEDYIKQCLDSIEDQVYFIDNDNYEVLIGIDGCHKTLAKIKAIRNQYRNVRVFMNESNSGVYATINALIDKAKNDIILRFDADDIMKPYMIKRGMYYAKNHDVVMFGYDVFYNDINKVNIQKFRCADGVIFLRKEVFERAGGFKPWPMAADSEFIARVRNNCNVKRTRARLFHRRLHDDSLTRNISTGYKSKQRRELAEKIRIYKEGEDIKIEMVKAKQNEI